MNGSPNLPALRPIIVRAGDLQALADRLELAAEAGQPPQPTDVTKAARVCRHAAVAWVRGISVSIP